MALVVVAGILPIAGPAFAFGNGTVTFDGGGFGHSIGLSQYGAQGQALDGRDYQTIVEHYYTGASLVDLASAVGSGTSPLLDYAEPLWLGIAANETSVGFVPRNGGLTICQEGGDCPIAPSPQADESWSIEVTGPGLCQFKKDGVAQGAEGSCVADITLDGGQVEFPGSLTVGHGTMRLRPDQNDPSASQVHVSFSMEMEDYIAGIAEVPSSWHDDALKAQAVAARSFAAAKVHQRETGTRSGPDADPALSSTWFDRCFCHLRTTTSDQAYSGWAQSQIPSWAAAVIATADEVLTHPSTGHTYEGVVDAFYSSSSGGVTETNVGGFGSCCQFPYLLSVDDHWSIEAPAGNPFATWSIQVAESTIIDRLSSANGAWEVTFEWLTDVEHLQGPPESWVRFTGWTGTAIQSVDVPGYWMRGNFGLRSPQIASVTSALDPGPLGATWHQNTGSVQSFVEPGDRFGAAIASGDFDGDSFRDVAVGAPFDGINSIATGGLVNVLFGSSSGLTDFGNQMFHQNSDDMDQIAEIDDRFGTTLASGDFNDDGRDDLIVGVPYEDVGSKSDAGIIHILVGTTSGLVPNRVVTQSSPGIPGKLEAGDRFGSALAVGDFNDDGYDDLAVSAAGEAIGSNNGAGNVTVIPGSSTGLDLLSATAIHQGTPEVDGAIEPGDGFGSALAAGDLDGDGHDDLIVGSSGEDIGTISNAGMIHIFPGDAGGVDPTASISFHQDTVGVPGQGEAGDGFGTVLATGDTDDNGRDEVFVGSPKENIGSNVDSGMVSMLVFDGSLNLTDGIAYHQNTSGIDGVAEAGDLFGASIGVGQMVGGSSQDLVIGAPGEAVGTKNGAGFLHLIPGSAGVGPSPSQEEAYTQSEMPSTGTSESGDEFGFALVITDIDGDGRFDAVVGSPGEAVGSVPDAGMIQTMEFG